MGIWILQTMSTTLNTVTLVCGQCRGGDGKEAHDSVWDSTFGTGII